MTTDRYLKLNDLNANWREFYKKENTWIQSLSKKNRHIDTLSTLRFISVTSSRYYKFSEFQKGFEDTYWLTLKIGKVESTILLRRTSFNDIEEVSWSYSPMRHEVAETATDFYLIDPDENKKRYAQTIEETFQLSDLFGVGDISAILQRFGLPSLLKDDLDDRLSDLLYERKSSLFSSKQNVFIDVTPLPMYRTYGSGDMESLLSTSLMHRLHTFQLN